MPFLSGFQTPSFLARNHPQDFFYLATPYSHPDFTTRELRYQMAVNLVALLLKDRLYVYCPVVHCHHVAMEHGLPADHLFWWNMNYTFIKASAGLIVAQIDGWNESKGIAAEMDLANELGKDIFFVDGMALSLTR